MKSGFNSPAIRQLTDAALRAGLKATERSEVTLGVAIEESGVSPPVMNRTG